MKSSAGLVGQRHFYFSIAMKEEEGNVTKTRKQKIGGITQPKILERNEISLCTCSCS